eukprot:TRINITY_DN1444_c0_g1_i2.p1 TRINITY_DN1444_c0_g1~~TRINITY_DN1444_c0_g1_i2.p1  ORF type:complete len:1867 (+),score=179.30 TRINITY_DN1444_c0_g1_i2:376-5976(+)
MWTEVSQTSTPRPSPRVPSLVACWNGTFFMYGSMANAERADTWVYDITSSIWQKISHNGTNLSPPEFMRSLSVDRTSGIIYTLFTDITAGTDSIWSFNMKTYLWNRLASLSVAARQVGSIPRNLFAFVPPRTVTFSVFALDEFKRYNIDLESGKLSSVDLYLVMPLFDPQSRTTLSVSSSTLFSIGPDGSTLSGTFFFDVNTNTVTLASQPPGDVVGSGSVFSPSSNAIFIISMNRGPKLSLFRLELNCPNNCSLNGVCTEDGYCSCNPSYGSSDCSVSCGTLCKNGGFCTAAEPQTCLCPKSWTGPDCSLPNPCFIGSPYIGSNSSVVSCRCLNGFRGANCTKSCSDCNGICNADGSCTCLKPYYYGDRCQYDATSKYLDPLSCPRDLPLPEMFGTTWCGANPTSVVRVHASVTPINSTGFKYECDPSGGPNSNCSAVSAVGTLGTGTQADPKSFVIYGLLDGQLVVASWTTENPGIAWKLGDEPVTFIRSSPLGFVLASDGHRFMIITKSRQEAFPVVFTGEWLGADSSTNLVLSDIVFVVTKEGDVYFIYPIAVFNNSSCRIFDLVLGAELDSPAIVRNIAWLQLGERGSSPVRAVVVLQPFGYDLSLTDPPRLNGTRPECTYTTYPKAQLRALFMFYDSHSAWLIAAPSLPLSSDEGVVFLNVSKTLFFSSEDSIVSADLYPECFSVGTPASAMFGSFLTKAVNGSSSLVIVRLDELAMHSGRCGMTSSWSGVYNVVYRYNETSGCQIVPLDACPLGYFLNGSVCEKRLIQSISLSFTPQGMARRFMTLPSGQLQSSAMSRLDLRFGTLISTAQTLFLYDAFFLADGPSRQLHVIGVQQNLRQIDAKLLVFDELRTFDLPSDLSAWDVSFNGQHIFLGARRQKWEIASQARLVEICRLLAKNDTEALQLYSSLESACKSSSNESVGYSDFVMAISMCQSSSYCPMFANGLYTDVAAAGFYTITPGILKKCESGFYCRQGSKLPCPRGFACPREGTFVPQKCWSMYDQTTTCYEEGLSRPKICPAGFICPTADTPPIPAPPGFFTVAASKYGPGLACNSSGDFCSIGAQGNRSCPRGLFCASSGDILPGICETAYTQNGTRVNNMTTYCPEGSSWNSPCPAGFVCPVPWQIERCLPGDYCPEGSQVAAKCPSGRFCPTPASSQICPAGFYCPERSWQPFRCSPLALCAEGSTVQRGWLTITIELSSLVILAIVFVVVRRVRANRRRSQALMSVARRGNNRFLTYEEALVDEIVDTDPLLPSSIQGAPDVVGLNLEFSNLELKVSGGKKSVLQDVSGSFKAGHLSAVMGPSGAGKSSLLSVLSGAVKLSGGFITVNESTFNFEKLKRLIGFVPQEDVMHRSLTVIEILRFNAKMRLPSGTSDEEVENIVQDLIEVLNLRKVQYSVIGDETTRGISGGERKRVNIGMELAANPRILFLDEPTSGLDSSSAVQVCQCLKTIAQRANMTVVCVIHQPRVEVYEMFDNVLFLAPGGRTVFQGSILSADEYFKEFLNDVKRGANPADVYMDLIASSSSSWSAASDGRDLVALWQQHQNRIALPSASSSSVNREAHSLSSVPLASFWIQLFHFSKRSLLLQVRDVISIVLNLFLVFVAGLLLGFVYADASYRGPAPKEDQALCPSFIKDLCEMPQEDTYVLQFALLNMALGLTAIAGSLRTFGDEHVTFQRETRAGLNSFAFFLGKNLAAIPMLLVPPLIMLTIFYFISSPASGFWEMYAILILVQSACTGAGYLMSIVLPASSSLLCGVVFVIVSTLFSGANPTLAKLNSFGIPGQVLASMSYSRWSIEALYSLILLSVQSKYNIDPSLKYWGFDIARYPLIDVLALSGLALGLRIVAFVELYFLRRAK